MKVIVGYDFNMEYWVSIIQISTSIITSFFADMKLLWSGVLENS